MRRLFHRLTVAARDQPTAGQAVDAGEIVAREHRDDPRSAFGSARIDFANMSVRVRRTEKVGVGLPRLRHIIGVLAVAGKEAIVFFAANGLADAVEIIRSHDYLRMAAAPCCTALTMF